MSFFTILHVDVVLLSSACCVIQLAVMWNITLVILCYVVRVHQQCSLGWMVPAFTLCSNHVHLSYCWFGCTAVTEVVDPENTTLPPPFARLDPNSGNLLYLPGENRTTVFPGGYRPLLNVCDVMEVDIILARHELWTCMMLWWYVVQLLWWYVVQLLWWYVVQLLKT